MKERILDILHEINGEIDYEKETALVEKGLYSSLEIMDIVGMLEDVFCFDIPIEEIRAENFESLYKITLLVERCMNI